MMSPVSNYVVELLADDMMSHGILNATAKNYDEGPRLTVREILTEVLRNKAAEIGETKLKDDYVEFIAWTGDLLNRVERALTRVNEANLDDKEFAYWLCLPQNVDRFEENEQQE